MLLLDVQVEIDPEKDDVLNDWYHAHVPRLVSVPGYDSGRRYVALTPGPRYLALYEIRDESYIPALLGSDKRLRNELTLSEWARWDKDLVPHMSHCKTNLYRPPDDLGPPILRTSPAIVAIRMDIGEKNRERAREAMGAAMGGIIGAGAEALSARLLEAARHPAAEWLGTSPELLFLIECSGPQAAKKIARGEGASRRFLESLRALAGGAPQVTAYRIIAEHWPVQMDGVDAE
jgi:hypothetical protein